MSYLATKWSLRLDAGACRPETNAASRIGAHPISWSVIEIKEPWRLAHWFVCIPEMYVEGAGHVSLGGCQAGQITYWRHFLPFDVCLQVFCSEALPGRERIHGYMFWVKELIERGFFIQNTFTATVLQSNLETAGLFVSFVDFQPLILLGKLFLLCILWNLRHWRRHSCGYFLLLAEIWPHLFTGLSCESGHVTKNMMMVVVLRTRYIIYQQ